MASRLITIPFALGIDEQTAPRELEPRALREAVNVRQRSLKAFGMRADYLAQSMTEFDGTWTPRDLYNLNGRLFSLGDRQSSSAPTDIAEFVEQPGGTWKGTLPVGGTGTRVPPITALRHVGQTPDTSSPIQTARVAATGGLVCLVYGHGQTTNGATSYVHIFRASTDSTVLLKSVAASNLHVVAADTSFWVLGIDSIGDVVGYRFLTTADDDLRAPIQLYSGPVTTAIFSACTVTRVAGPIQFLVFAREGATTALRLFDADGTAAAGWAGPAVAADALAVEASRDVGHAVIATRVGAADANAITYHLPTSLIDPATVIAGPTAMFGETVQGDLSLMRPTLANASDDLVTEDANARILRRRFNTTTHAGSTLPAHNYSIAGTGVQSVLGTVQPLVSGDGSNQLVIYDALSSTSIYVAAQDDVGIASSNSASVGKGSNCCIDATTGLYYWARMLEGTDAQAIAGVTEFVLGSVRRRQACQVGNTMLLAGGLPLSFGGRQVVESGFLEKPVFSAALTPQTTGGDLIGGATYDYVAIYQWVDEQNRQAKSRISDIQTVTLGAAHDSVLASIFTAHTMRSDQNSGSTVTVSLYRVDAVDLSTHAEIVGTNVVDPPSASLNGQSLQFFVTDSTGTDPFVVIFGAGDTNPTAIAATINAVSSGRLTATNEDGRIKLQVDEAGDGTLLQIFATTGATILGFPGNTTVAGESSFTKGSVFHLAGTQKVGFSTEFGAAVSISDDLSDEELLEQETLYTQGEQGALTGILEREAPPPCKFAAACGMRAFIGGLPDPTEVAISFELSPAEALSFSSEFAFRAWVDGDVTAVASLDGAPVAFTRDDIYRFPSQLPNDQGGDGELGPAVRIPSEGGCINEHSILETSAGLFYESRDGKLMLLPRGGQPPVWIGQHIHDTLLLFPEITGAAYCDEDHCAVFTCRAPNGANSIVLVYDLRIGQWYRDEFSPAQSIVATVDYLGRLAYIDGATVRLQSASLTPSTFIPYNTTTGSLAPFKGGHGGHGELICVSVDGEFRGNSTLTGRISYNDGQSFTTFLVKTFATPTFAVGDSFVVQWYPRVRKGSAYVLDFAVTALAGAATPGLIINSYTVEVAEAQPIKRARTTAAQRG